LSARCSDEDAAYDAIKAFIETLSGWYSLEPVDGVESWNVGREDLVYSIGLP